MPPLSPGHLTKDLAHRYQERPSECRHPQRDGLLHLGELISYSSSREDEGRASFFWRDSRRMLGAGRFFLQGAEWPVLPRDSFTWRKVPVVGKAAPTGRRMLMKPTPDCRNCTLR